MKYSFRGPVLALVALCAAAAVVSAAGRAETARAEARPLVLYTNDFEDIIGERFTADTGIEIAVVQESGGNLLARIAAERGNPQWDVLLFDGVGSLHALDQQGQFYTGFEPSNLSNLLPHAEALLPQNRAWFPVGETASNVIIFRHDLSVEPPATFFDLTHPRFRGLIGMADPAVAAPAYPAVAWFHYNYGFDRARDFYTDLLANDLQVFRTNGPVSRAIQSGDISVALLSSPQVYRLLNAGAPVTAVWPTNGAPASSRGVAIQRTTAQLSVAQTFVEWMLRPETQQFLTDNAGHDGWFRASVAGVTPLAGGPPAGAVYNVAPAPFAAQHEAEIKNWFADMSVR